MLIINLNFVLPSPSNKCKDGLDIVMAVLKPKKNPKFLYIIVGSNLLRATPMVFSTHLMFNP